MLQIPSGRSLWKLFTNFICTPDNGVNYCRGVRGNPLELKFQTLKITLRNNGVFLWQWKIDLVSICSMVEEVEVIKGFIKHLSGNLIAWRVETSTATVVLVYTSGIEALFFRHKGSKSGKGIQTQSLSGLTFGVKYFFFSHQSAHKTVIRWPDQMTVYNNNNNHNNNNNNYRIYREPFPNGTKLYLGERHGSHQTCFDPDDSSKHPSKLKIETNLETKIRLFEIAFFGRKKK